MQIEVFDVAHGFCACIVADNGNLILIDCGHNEHSGFRPSNHLLAHGCTGIEEFVVSNYDEDHLSDLPNLSRGLPIQTLRRNRSIDADELHRLKLRAGPVQSGLQALLEMIRSYTEDVTTPPEFPDIELACFWNRYPAFDDTNNLSLVTFLHYRDVHIVFPGDLEKAGWRALLEQRSFREHLGRVNFFVASHHGRQSGYCAEVFDCCHPEIVIISDEAIKYDTQETDYRRHASGIQWPDGHRYVLTTRKHGMITISQSLGEEPTISTIR